MNTHDPEREGRKRQPSLVPPGSWPPRMAAPMAAGYCGEKHIEDFLERVGSTYPEPRVVDSTRRKFWYRDDLDKALGLAGSSTPSGLGAKFGGKIGKDRHG